MTHHIRPLDIIRHKCSGIVLSDAEINAFIHAGVNLHTPNPPITESQITAFLMAVFHCGLTQQELAALTRAMRFSGETFARPADTPSLYRVDKHSPGGVGDKTSLLIAPIV